MTSACQCIRISIVKRGAGMQTGTTRIASDGAELQVNWSGDGPMLLMIPGGGGTGARYAAVAGHLADTHRVVWYDRRCSGASTGDRDAFGDMAQQARDAAALIAALGDGRADVFGNSSGASIALKLAEDHPQAINRVIVHEPPVLPLLDDGAAWIAYSDKVVAAFASIGAMPAMGMFLSEIKGHSGPPPGPRPAPQDMVFFLTRELPVFCRYAPDLDRLRANGVAMVTAAGRDSADAYYARTARLLAQTLPCGYHEFAGHHFSFGDAPETYARDIRAALALAGA